MANKLDTQSTVTLVLNGQQTQTSLRDVTSAVNSLRSSLNSMRQEDNPQLYQQRIQQLARLREAQAQMRNEILNGTEAQKTFWELFKKGLTDATNAGKSTAFSLIREGISSALSYVKELWNGSRQAYDEAQRAQTQLQTSIKSTGGIAGESIDQLQKYQQALMDQTGVDDDVIAKGEEMLLTFTNIRGKIYEQALPSIVDMTAGMNGGKVSMEGIQKTAIQVGKALNDPINGATALRKVGVTLDDQQKENIKTLVNSNKMMDAQAIILQELQKEFGGTAKAIADTDVGAMQKFDTRMGNLQENFGRMITTGRSMLATFFEPLVGWLEKATTTKLSDTLEQDKAALAGATLQLQQSNISHGDRVKLINQLKEKYPDYLGMVDAEKTKNSELIPLLNQINDAMVLRIAYQRKSEDLQGALQDEADAMLRMDKAGQQFGMTMANMIAKFKDAGIKIVMPENLTDLQQADFLLKQIQRHSADGSGLNTNLMGHDLQIAKQQLMQFQGMYKAASDNRQKVLDDQERFAKQYNLDENGKDKSKSVPGTGVIPPTSGPSQAEKDAAAKKLAQFNKLLEETKSQYLELAESARKGTVDDLDAQLKIIQDKYEKLVGKLKSLASDKLLRDPAMKKQLLGYVDDITKQGGLEDQAEDRARREAQQKRDEDLKKQQTEAKRQQGERSKFSSGFDKFIEQGIGEGFDNQRADNGFAQSEEMALAASEEAKQNIKDKYRDIDLQLEKKYLQTLKQYRSASGKETSDLDKKIAQIDVQTTANATEDKIKIRQKEFQLAKDITNGLGNLIQVTMGNSALGIAFQKTVTIAQLAIDTASAISSVTAQNAKTSLTPLDFALRVAAAIGTVLANIAAAKSALTQSNEAKPGQVKKAAKGALVEGPSHDNGGINLVNTQTGEVIGNMEGGEAIISKDTYRKNPVLVNELLYNGRYRNGAPVRVNTEMAVKATSSYLANGATTSATGGGTAYTSSSTAAGTSNDLAETHRLLGMIAKKFDEFSQKPWDFNNRAFQEYQQKLDRISDKASGK